jgi:hypothetical protein
MENQMPLSRSGNNNNRRQHHFTRRFRFRSVSPIIRRHVEQHTHTQIHAKAVITFFFSLYCAASVDLYTYNLLKTKCAGGHRVQFISGARA